MTGDRDHEQVIIATIVNDHDGPRLSASLRAKDQLNQKNLPCAKAHGTLIYVVDLVTRTVLLRQLAT